MLSTVSFSFVSLNLVPIVIFLFCFSLNVISQIFPFYLYSIDLKKYSLYPVFIKRFSRSINAVYAGWPFDVLFWIIIFMVNTCSTAALFSLGPVWASLYYIVSFILLVLLFIILSNNLEMLFDKEIPLLFDKGSLSFLPLSIFIIIDLSHDCGICSKNYCLNILQIIFLLILPLYFYYFLGFL